MSKPVRHIAIAVVAGFLAACGSGGGGGGGSGQAQSNQPQIDPVVVTITKSSNGCLLSHNSDAAVNYLLGSHQARTLLWNCANIDTRSRVGVEAFFTFDDTQRCLVEQSIAWKAGDCSRRATAPSMPSLSASIRTISQPQMGGIGGGRYAIDLDAEVTVTGNLTAFGIKVYVSSSPPHFASLLNIGNEPLSGLSYILPGEKRSIVFPPILSDSTTVGQDYTFTLTVKDYFDNDIASTSFNLTAP